MDLDINIPPDGIANAIIVGMGRERNLIIDKD